MCLIITTFQLLVKVTSYLLLWCDTNDEEVMCLQISIVFTVKVNAVIYEECVLLVHFLK